eukprot:1329876-Amorphochlora_amoeboformis.AAC.1
MSEIGGGCVQCMYSNFERLRLSEESKTWGGEAKGMEHAYLPLLIGDLLDPACDLLSVEGPKSKLGAA